ncbi:2,4'-dihydroxyacetophenone dioxygenase family protein [Variovorax sp. KK3]|uniref:2,4'-dihydroxyacetophenone dioxygenase family protein n=1 Tax=Variovorax sp. KK3 TaxID=1855728 RepID=UPI00097CBF26|nr:2,4'-dihydroxyacetophenone dioxygenase family protein [Variovorax sp. KK3]
MLIPTQGDIPAAILRSERDLPMVQIAPGLKVQLMQVDFDHNIRITRSLLDPGMRLRTHLHSGHVYAWTLAGTWKYIEYPEASTANSFLYEPAGSTHTLVVPEDSPEPADVIFIVHGSNVELDEDGKIVGVTDAAAIARAYLRACEEQGLPRPDVIGLPADWRG